MTQAGKKVMGTIFNFLLAFPLILLVRSQQEIKNWKGLWRSYIILDR